jgi:hypothetical protein
MLAESTGRLVPRLYAQQQQLQRKPEAGNGG